jgi:putative hydrolase of the HAD superfamily
MRSAESCCHCSALTIPRGGGSANGARLPKVLSLDLDNTLWPVGPVIAAAERAVLAWLRAHHPQAADGNDLESMRSLRADVARRFPGLQHDLTFVRRQALTEQFAAAGYADAAAAEQALDVFLHERNRVDLYDDVLPALARLKTRYRLFAVSNGNADLDRCGLGGWFEGHVTAASAGAAKPDARIFAELAAAARVGRDEILHVGDDPLADVVGATQAGIASVWLNRHARPWPAHFAPPARTIASLRELV